jgi:hypothetical protein
MSDSIVTQPTLPIIASGLVDSNNRTEKFSFSGHESFVCRHFWPKKGYDFVKKGLRFADSNSVVALGVGKNMVASIQYWMRAFGLLDQASQISDLAHYLFGDKGKDIYLEKIGTLWLLHYQLVRDRKASIYHLVFNEFRKERPEFTKSQLVNYLERKCRENGNTVSSKTLQRDVDVFVRMYARPTPATSSIEDDFVSLLIDLELLGEIEQLKSAGGSYYRIEAKDRENIPAEIVLYAILMQNLGDSISWSVLLNEPNNAGVVFAMTANGLLAKINEIITRFPDITLKDDAGIRELQFVRRPTPQQVLDTYYGS